MTDQAQIQDLEATVWRDLISPLNRLPGGESSSRTRRKRPGPDVRPSSLTASRGMGGYGSKDVWTGGAFSGWFPIGTWFEFRDARRNTKVARLLDQQVIKRMRLARGSVSPGVHLVYRLMYPSPVHAGIWKTLYLGSAKHGNVAYRLQDHFTKTEPPGGSWYSTISSTLGPNWRSIRDEMRVQAGHIVGHVSQPPGSRQSELDYNELALMEKILQRRYEPLFWDPDVRTFDETRS